MQLKFSTKTSHIKYGYCVDLLIRSLTKLDFTFYNFFNELFCFFKVLVDYMKKGKGKEKLFYTGDPGVLCN